MDYTLSPSSIAVFLDCPRCFWLQLNRKIRRPSGAFPGLPGGMDRILKEHFDKHRKDETHPEELEHIKGKLYPDVDKLNEWRDSKRGLRFHDKETGSTLMGAIDDLFVTEEGKYAPLDFKTRGVPRREDTHKYSQHQMDIYATLLGKNGMEPADFAILIYYHPIGVNKAHDIIFDPDPIKVKVDIERGEKMFRDAVKCLNNEMPDPSVWCEYCRWAKKTSNI